MARFRRPDEIDAFRAALCSAAERLFATRGYDGVTMRTLAAELGCSPMTPYRYFANKEAIFDAVRLAAFDRFGARIERAAAIPAEPADRLDHLARAFVAFARSEPSAYRIMFEVARPAALGAEMGDDPARRAVLLRGWLPLVANLACLAERGEVEGDPLVLAHLAFASLHGLVMLDLSGKYVLGLEIDDVIEPMIARLRRGFGVPVAMAPVGEPHGAATKKKAAGRAARGASPRRTARTARGAAVGGPKDATVGRGRRKRAGR
ncbi:MAG: TetR/AcrR family transcriptional regulator [Myxococcota bacterium]